MSSEEYNHFLAKLHSDPAPFREFRTVLQILGDKWSALILLCLFSHPLRFGEIAELIPDLNPRTLTARLRRLESFGLITRHEYKEFPPRTEYAVTDKAEDLRKALHELKVWAKKYC